MGDWRPIETAPMDGTKIDVWEYCHNPEWRPKEHGFENGHRIVDVEWKDGCWQEYNLDRSEWWKINNQHYTVSHWMPTPEPPKKS